MPSRTGRRGGKKSPILIVSDDMAAGGMERQIVELIKGLKRRGNFWIMFGVLDRGGEREQEARQYADAFLPIEREWRFDISAVFSLFMLSKIHRIELIHAFGWMSGLAGLCVAKTFRIPIINSSIRNAPPKLHFRQRVSRRCMLLSDAIVANSYAGLRAYKVHGHPRSRVIYNGVDLTRFENIEGVKQNQRTICMVANFTNNKGHEALVRSLPIIHKKFADAKLTLVGRGDQKLYECQKIVSSLGLNSSVEFIINTDNPEPYIAKSQICVLITNTDVHGEGISNAIIEYFALGKPVVATDCGGNREIVEDRGNGCLLANNRPKTIAEKMLKLLRDPDKASAMGRAGQKKVREEFALNRMVDDYEKLYYQLLRKREVIDR